MSVSLVNGGSLKTPFGSGKLLSIREASTDLPECAVVQLSFGTAYLSLSSLGAISKTVTAKAEGGGEVVEKKEGGDNEEEDENEEKDDDDGEEEEEEEEEETTPSKSKSSNRFGSKVAAARTKKMQKARENFQRRAEAAAAAAGGSGSNFIVELEEGDEDGENEDEDDVENASKVVKTPKASSIKSPSSGLSPRTPASQQAQSLATTAGKGTPSASNAPMTEAKRALAEAKRAELLLRSPVMQKQPRELTEAQKLALASKGVLKELVAENDLGSGAGGSGGGTGVLEAIAAVEVGEGLGGLLSTAAAITVVGVCVGGLYMMMRRR